MALDNYDPSTALSAYYPSRDERRPARLWATEKLLHDLAAVGIVGFFEGPGSNPTVLTGYSATKAWLQVSSGVTDAPGVIRSYDGVGDPTLLASWPQMVTGATSLPALANFLQSGEGAVARSIQDKLRETVSVTDFGAVMDGSADAIDALERFLQYCATTGAHGVIPAGTLSITPLSGSFTGDLSIECHGTIVNRSGASATAEMLRLTGDGTNRIKWRGGAFDGDGGPRSLFVYHDWRHADVEVDEVRSITCDTDSPGSTSALWASDCLISRTRWHYALDMHEGSSTQGSLPRVISVSAQSGECHATIHAGDAYNIHGLLVVGDIGGGEVDMYCHGKWRDVHDNGIYNVGDAARVRVFDVNVDQIDELAVNAGPGVVQLFRPIGRNLTNSLGIQSGGEVEVFDGDLHFSVGPGPMKTRSGNVSSRAFRSYRTRYDVTPAARLCDFGTFGTIEEFVSKGDTWIYRYDVDVFLNNNAFALSPGSRCRVECDSEFILEDAYGARVVSGAADNGSGLIRLTVDSTAGMTTGEAWVVSDVGGTTEANGEWTITVVDNTRIDLQGSTFSNAYTSGGTIGTVPSSATIFLIMPTVTEISNWNGRFTNRTRNSSVDWRLASARQRLFDRSGHFGVTNTENEGSRNRGGASTLPPGFSWGDGQPLTGYHPAGHIVMLRNAASPGAVGYYCTVEGNPGTWRPFGPMFTTLQASAGKDWGEIAAGASASQTIVVTGAVVGDFVFPPAMSISHGGLVLSGYVSATDEVNVVAYNPTGSPIDLGSATMRVRVAKL